MESVLDAPLLTPTMLLAIPTSISESARTVGQVQESKIFEIEG
jgi:hypothetical protein